MSNVIRFSKTILYNIKCVLSNVNKMNGNNRSSISIKKDNLIQNIDSVSFRDCARIFLLRNTLTRKNNRIMSSRSFNSHYRMNKCGNRGFYPRVMCTTKSVEVILKCLDTKVIMRNIFYEHHFCWLLLIRKDLRSNTTHISTLRLRLP